MSGSRHKIAANSDGQHAPVSAPGDACGIASLETFSIIMPDREFDGDRYVSSWLIAEFEVAPPMAATYSTFGTTITAMILVSRHGFSFGLARHTSAAARSLLSGTPGGCRSDGIGTAALNQWSERNADARCADGQPPFPSGRIGARPRSPFDSLCLPADSSGWPRGELAVGFTWFLTLLTYLLIYSR